jgi:amino acid adenylation domain-containing protein
MSNENKTRLTQQITATLEDLAGMDLAGVNDKASFFEIGFDSLLLTQAASALKKKFGVPITFRQLMEDLTTIDAVADYLAGKTVAPNPAPTPTAEVAAAAPTAPAPSLAAPVAAAPTPVVAATALSTASFEMAAPVVDGQLDGKTSAIERVVKEQLALMNRQLETLRQLQGRSPAVASPAPVSVARPAAAAPGPKPTPTAPTAAAAPADANKSFGPYKPINTTATTDLTSQQQRALDDLIRRYTAKTPGSKRHTQESRACFSDPRSVAGFRPFWKEIVYPIVTQRSSGSRFWDIDGNEFIDLTMGFGTNLLGHMPPYVHKALSDQLKLGIEVGPQSPVAGKVAKLLCEFSGHERAAFCNTGSEAILAGIRVARTVTGRDKICMFNGAYHGLCDEVLARGSAVGGRRVTTPAAPGILKNAVREILVLDYGTQETLEILEKEMDEIAVVLVEPVQSRHPDLQPADFLRKLREITAARGTALLFDEVITGFRCHQYGAQAYFGVRADLATWGKVIGGGMPIGALTGAAKYLDALDGGFWQYGDNSIPETGVTFFAGTYVRHPMTMAASLAVLTYLKEQGPTLQEKLTAKTVQFATDLRAFLQERGAPLVVEQFASILYFHFPADIKYGSMLWFYLREKGIHFWENRPGFISTAHTDAEIAYLAQAFKESIVDMQAGGFLPPPPPGAPEFKPTLEFPRSTVEPGLNGSTPSHDSTPPVESRQSEPVRSATLAGNGAQCDKTIGLPEAQKGLVTIAALGKDACRTYTEGNTLEWRGPLNVDALRHALQQCLDRHEALRTSLDADGQSQTVHAHCQLEIPFDDFSQLGAEAQRERLQALFHALESVPADIYAAPSMRARIVKLAPDRHLSLVLFHHTTGNGPSYWVYFEDLCAFYEANCGGAPFSRPEPMQFSAYVDWRLQRMKTPEYAAAEAFWLKQFAKPVPVLDLPTDRPRPEVKSYRGGRAILRLDASFTNKVRKAGASQKGSLYMTLLTGYKAIMHRLSGQDDVIVGTPFESEVRALPGGEGLFANTTNMTGLRSEVTSSTTFAQMLAATRAQILECREHGDFFFGSLMQKLGLRSGTGKASLFSVSFNYESGKFQRHLAGVDMEYLTDQVPYRCPKDTALSDLNVNVAERNGELICECDFDADLFDKPTVERILDQWRILLEAAAANPDQRLAELPLISAAERHQVLVEWNRTAVDYPRDCTLHSLIERQVAQTPDATAVFYEGASLSYRQLNARANQLARHLRGLGVGPDSLVGICLERSLDMVVGLLGILKAGGAYVPLDPEYPKDRLAFMLTDAGAPVLLTQAGLVGTLPPHPGRLLRLDADWADIADENPDSLEPLATAQNLAYMIYTSGSTGRPKGAMNTHVAIVNRLLWMQDTYRLTPADRVLQKTPFSFDVSVWEFFWPLLTGATMVVAAPGGHRDGHYLSSLIQREQVTTTHFVPSMLAVFLEQPGLGTKCASLKRVICSGEALSFELQQRFYAALPAELHNLYGPTEAAVDVTFWPCERGSRTGIVPIGKPIANIQIHILDRELQPTPIGVPGELHIGGIGLARGYHNRPELTAEKFIPNPFSNEAGARLYKTGDLARYLPDGNIEYLGRLDNQVKIRGLRIELGEIEAVLDSHPAVRESAVVVREDKPERKTLVAYVAQRTSGAPDGQTATAEMENQWQTQWERIYQTALAQMGNQTDGLQNIDSVINRETNLKDIAAHTNEWIEVTMRSLRALKPRRILEAGCGTGQLLLRLAPEVEAYWGSDFAGAAIKKLREEARARGLASVQVLERAADSFEGIPEKAFDLFILNSVSQYFPDPEYLLRVLEGAVKMIAPGGRMYIGDVQSHALLECFHAATQLKAAPAEATVDQINQRVRQRVGLEGELVVDPEFFKLFQARIPEITAVDIQLRRGHLINETTQYHYDVVLTVGGKPDQLAVPQWLGWRDQQLNLETLRQRLESDRPAVIGFRGVPNRRLVEDIAALQALKAAPAASTAGQLRAALAPEAGIDPEDLWVLGEKSGYHVDVRWSAEGVSAEMDVVFSRAEKRAPGCVTDFGDSEAPLKRWQDYANHPANSMLASKLPQILIDHVKARLPDYMVPATVMVLADLPKTPSGKIDRKALPAPAAVTASSREFVAPRNEKEKALAAIWQQLLGLEKVSVLDNFFEIGGDSLIGFRSVNRANQAGLEMTLRTLFEHKTVAGIVKAIEQASRSEAPKSPGAQVTRVSRESRRRSLSPTSA